MKGIIFSAGLGTRLKPFTESFPKALFPINDTPLLEIVIKEFHHYGIDDIVINVHHFADMIEEWIGQQEWIRSLGIKIEFSDEREFLLDTGGAILKAKEKLKGEGPIIAHNVDILSNANLKELVSRHQEGSLATLLVSPRKSSRGFLFEPRSMKLAGWTNHNTSEVIITKADIPHSECLTLAFSGIQVLSQEIFEAMEEYTKEKSPQNNSSAGIKFSIRDFYLWAASRYSIIGINAPDLKVLDVGKADAIEPARHFLSISSNL